METEKAMSFRLNLAHEDAYAGAQGVVDHAGEVNEGVGDIGGGDYIQAAG